MKRKPQLPNIFLKSVLRQRLRSLCFFLLIIVATFAFVLRTTEFIVVRDRIYEVADFYRSVGYLQVQEGMYGNVLEGAQIIAGSDYIDFEDRRRGFEAVLSDMNNGAISGIIPSMGGWWDMNRLVDPEMWPYAYFYGVVQSVEILDTIPATMSWLYRIGGEKWTLYPEVANVRITMLVDDVAVGFSEHVMVGQYLIVEHVFGDEPNPFVNMQVGERYFMRAGLYAYLEFPALMETGWPYHRVQLDLPVLGRDDFLTARPLNDQGLWYVPVPSGEVDFKMADLEHLAAEIARAQNNHRVLQLRTTADMTALPATQGRNPDQVLHQGRFIDHQDYLEARPVAVIHTQFAEIRGLEIGDTITISIPNGQRIVQPHYLGVLSGDADTAHFGDGEMDFHVQGNLGDYFIEELELEIIGMYLKFANRVPGANHTFHVQWVNHIYLPDSLLPVDFVPVDSYLGNPEYVWNIWYSFALADTRNENAFLLENRERLSELGIDLIMIPSGAENFWASAEPILMSITFNAVMFWMVLILVFGLVSFLYLHQRRRDFAIMRALGNPTANAIKQLMTPTLFFGMPAILMGALGGWFFSLQEVLGTLNPLVAVTPGYELKMDFPLLWLLAQILVISIMLLGMIYEGGVLISKRSALELLQDRRAKSSRKKQLQSNESMVNNPLHPNISSFNTSGKKAPKTANASSGNSDGSRKNPARSLNKSKAYLDFILRHIVRAPLKSLLTMIIAMFFMIALGMLREAISHFESEINRLYETTVVSGEIRRENFLAIHPHATMGDIILRSTVVNLMELDYFQNYYAVAALSSFNLTAPDEAGSFPALIPEGFEEELSPSATIVRSEASLIAFNDETAFMAEHSLQLDDAVSDEATIANVGLEIEFADGFSWEHYIYDDDGLLAPIPAILSESYLQFHDLSLGDLAFIANHRYIFDEADGEYGFVEVYYPIFIIGKHNGHLASHLGARGYQVGEQALFIPLPALELLGGDRLRYITLRFEIDINYNRDMEMIRNEMQEIVNHSDQHEFLPLEISLYDEELRLVVEQMEQNLSLLQLLYPVAILLSVLIGSGFALLLMLQNAKVAAIMRVLGHTKARARIILCAEHMVITTFGLLIGWLGIPLLGIELVMGIILFSGLYLIGATTGSIVGVTIITNRAPLDLLQVQE